jgi:hypothetical protein
VPRFYFYHDFWSRAGNQGTITRDYPSSFGRIDPLKSPNGGFSLIYKAFLVVSGIGIITTWGIAMFRSLIKILITVSLFLNSPAIILADDSVKIQSQSAVDIKKAESFKKAKAQAFQIKIKAVAQSAFTTAGTIGFLVLCRSMLEKHPEARGFITGLMAPAIAVELIILGLQASAATEDYMPCPLHSL